MTRKQDARTERGDSTRVLEELRRADRLSTVAKIASSIGHELGTPLNVVSGRAMMIQMDDAVSDDVKSNARIIQEQATEMAAIIRRLLDFARREPLQTHDVGVRAMVDYAATLIGPIAETRGVHISIDVNQSLRAHLDERKALQVLTSLLMNSIEAMPDGGNVAIRGDVRHVASPPDRRAVEGDYVVLRVRDEGIGIEDSMLEHVFEPFLSKTPVGRRTGMGLSVCHGIVREHGGWIEVASAPGEGTEFTVYLPKRSE